MINVMSISNLKQISLKSVYGMMFDKLSLSQNDEAEKINCKVKCPVIKYKVLSSNQVILTPHFSKR